MACNCLETTKEKLIAKIKEINPTYTIGEAYFENRILAFDENGSKVILTHSFKYEYTFIKTNGTNSIPKNKTINLNPSYCGFCGEKFD